jgi:uncharacterized membrane protein
MPSLSIKALQMILIAAAVAYVFISPPFQVPDENYHFRKSYQLSLGRLLCIPKGEVMGDTLPASISALSDVDLPRENKDGGLRRYSFDDLVAAWHRPLDPDAVRFVEFPNVASYAPSLYAPQAIGIVVGRTLGLPPLGLFYAARLVNALAGIALIIAAVNLIPFGRRVLLGLAAFPTMLYQTASVSPDATILGLSFLVVALAIRSAAPVPLRRTDAAVLPAVGLLALAKGLYLPLALAGLCRNSARRTALMLASVAVGSLLFIAWTRYSVHTQLPVDVISRKTHQLVKTATLDAQIQVIAAAPLAYARILVESFTERLPVYVLQIVGRFGWSAFLLPLAAYVLAACLFVLSLAPHPCEGGSPSHGRRLWWLALLAGGVVLIETALYLTGTPLAADYIQGTQGRYFLPYLPLLGLALLRPKGGRSTALMAAAFPWAACLMIAVGLLVALDSFWISGFVDYGNRGLPPIHATAAGLLRCLFLPSSFW